MFTRAILAAEGMSPTLPCHFDERSEEKSYWGLQKGSRFLASLEMTGTREVNRGVG